MARPKSEDKRNAILAAAIRVIVAQGLGAPTAMIAQEAGVANGSLFTYFETKAELLNQLYLELKSELAAAAFRGLPIKAELRKQASYMWTHWMDWAVAFPEKRRVLAMLSVCEMITPESRKAGHESVADVARLLEEIRINGPMRSSSMSFVVAIMNSLADATMDFMIADPANAKKHCKAGFEALWRVVA